MARSTNALSHTVGLYGVADPHPDSSLCINNQSSHYCKLSGPTKNNKELLSLGKSQGFSFLPKNQERGPIKFFLVQHLLTGLDR